MQMRDASNTLRTITGITMRDAGGTLRTIQTIKGRDAGGVLRVLFSGMAVSISPDPVTGYASHPGSYTVITGGCYGTVTGGTAPYTYAWTVSSGWSATAPALVGTAFASPPLDGGDSADGTAYLTVTDANSQVAVSNTVALFAANYYSSFE